MWSANFRWGLTPAFPDYKADIHSDCVEYQGIPCGVSKYPFLKASATNSITCVPRQPYPSCRSRRFPHLRRWFGALNLLTCFWIHSYFRWRKETAVIWAVGVSLLIADSSDKLPHNYISGLVFGETFLTRHPAKDSRLLCFTHKWYMLHSLYN
jgi:hypothetical protein